MAFEVGGRGDKLGNRYEIIWVVKKLIEVIDEKIDYIILEPINDIEEEGIDVSIGKKDGTQEHQQCKARNGWLEKWNFSDLNSKNILQRWKKKLDQNPSDTVSLVSPLAFTNLEDLVQRAKTNENTQLFYQRQILESDKTLFKIFKQFCNAMNLDLERESDLDRAIAYLRRISYQQVSGTDVNEIVLRKINLLFLGDENGIADILMGWISADDFPYGTKVTMIEINSFLNKMGIAARNLANDSRILPRIDELNKEYVNGFYKINDSLINRKEFIICEKGIEESKSLVIHGKAGIGKSGCSLNIVKYCQKKKIPYLAIKLDKKIPNGSAENWGKELGFPASIAHCLHEISKDKRAVLILDQLDALRWTTMHSRDALDVCVEIIEQINQINSERKCKIQLVLVCRSYDLDNDNEIKSLLDTYQEGMKWEKIKITELEDYAVKDIVNETMYNKLTPKLKKILKIPSNLFIWQKLDDKNRRDEFSSTNVLIDTWWKQLMESGIKYGLEESSLTDQRDKMVQWMYKNGKIYFPKNLFKDTSGLKYLVSNNFFIIQGNKISFAHQSILDNFIADEMFDRYYTVKNISQVIGNKSQQTPGRRYQVQMFFEKLLSYDSEDFLNAGQRMFASNDIRFFIKFVFFEVLNQIENVTENIKGFILNKCQDETWAKYIINNVILFRPQYVNLLVEESVLQKWFPDKRALVIKLLSSIAPHYSERSVEFIRECIFISDEVDNEFKEIFQSKISEDTSYFLDLRIEFYKKYPEMLVNDYWKFKFLFERNSIESVKILKIILINKDKYIHDSNFGEELINDIDNLLVQNPKEIVDILIPSIPKYVHVRISSGWSNEMGYKRSLERAVIKLIKKCNKEIIDNSPEFFFRKYKTYMSRKYSLFNEVILDGFLWMSTEYSNRIIRYIADNIDYVPFCKTNGDQNELSVVRKVLAKHAIACSEEVYKKIEHAVIHFISPRARHIYKNRSNYNKITYQSFWGDFQLELLSVLPKERLSNEARELIRILYRKFPRGVTSYNKTRHYGSVESPIAGKELSDTNWLGILSNKKIKNTSIKWKQTQNVFEESSIEQFSVNFEGEISKKPVKMINLVLSNKDKILKEFIDFWYRGIAYSQNIKQVSQKLLEEAILCFPYDLKTRRAQYLCEIVYKRSDIQWSSKIIDIVVDIALNHKDPDSSFSKIKNFETLRNEALNSVRGKAIQALGNLLYMGNVSFDKLKNVINKLTSEQNAIVRYASLYALYPVLNIDKKWALSKSMELYNTDFRMVGFEGSKNILFMLYSNHKTKVLKVIKKCFYSNDDAIIRSGSSILAEMYILKNEFNDVMNNVPNLGKTQVDAIFQMLLLYFNDNVYNQKIKQSILDFQNSKYSVEDYLANIFYKGLIDLERDFDFLMQLTNFEFNHKLIYALINYLKKQANSIVKYSEFILSVADKVIKNNKMEKDHWRVFEMDIAKLIIMLYDEATRLNNNDVSNKCLDLWDLMYKEQVGSIRNLSNELMKR